ncbi:MAG: hypothetical protein AMJ54_01970 [Deltaproteobacteria bacterium SG8_13]|nr:MAG: hypothetical protein AMJ54_01970 [Deltaproteobacteria bacterium SG8_13]
MPLAKTVLNARDWLGKIRVRWGIRRDQYKVAPGLYGVGRPDASSPVLVTANYKLSFDALRSGAGVADAWILVVDTRGINVWCAAGKGTFSTEEVVRQVKSSQLDRVVDHRRLILPQLSATGVASRMVKKGCGFKVTWGPVRAADLGRFLDAGMRADEPMRRVTFTLAERITLVPVELSFLPRYLLWSLAAAFLLSGFGAGVFSFQAAWFRGALMVAALAGGVFAGAVAAPILLPWIPVRSFSVKGAIVGVAAGLAIVAGFREHVNTWEAAALLICTAVISSYLTMNFTGSTPYTSPSGVEKEMRRAIPFQAGAALVVPVLWVAAAFV